MSDRLRYWLNRSQNVSEISRRPWQRAERASGNADSRGRYGNLTGKLITEPY